MSRTLMGTITDRAADSFGEVNKNNWDQWVDHWLEVGEKFHSELTEEGLLKTAEIVRGHIDWTKKQENRTLAD